jgi:hypothetical protein
MVFDDATARGSAIPSPSEGMLTYNKDTSGLELYDGSAFGPVGSDAGLIHIKTESFTGASAVNVNDVFSADFDRYVVIPTYVGSANAQCNVRLRVSGADDSSSNYQRQVFNVTDTATAFQRITGQNSMNNAFGHGTTSNGLVFFDFHRPFNTSFTYATCLGSIGGGDSLNAEQSTYRFVQTTSFTGFSIIVGSGNITGQLDVFGYFKG